MDLLKELGEKTFVLRGSNMIVEILPKEEIRTEGGLILQASIGQTKGDSAAAHEVITAKVLMCGQGYWNESAGMVEVEPGSGIYQDTHTGKYEALEVQPGAIIFLEPNVYRTMSHFPGIAKPTQNKLAMIKMDAIQAYFPTEQAYNEFKAKVNG
jgi:hypothetical protein